jgi:hypothetical protein
MVYAKVHTSKDCRRLNMKQRSSAYSQGAQIVSKARDFILGAFGLVCIMLAIVMTLADKLPAAGTLFTAGLLLCIFSSLSRFESIKGLGIEAKMAALDTKLDEAEHLLKHIRNSVGLTADVSFHVMGRLGRWDADLPKKEALEIADGFTTLLHDLGADEDEIDRRMAPWHRANMIDLALPIRNAIFELIQLKNQEITKASHELTQPVDPSNPEWMRLQDAISRNGAYLTMLNNKWKECSEEFIVEVEDLIMQAPTPIDDEKRELIIKLRVMIDDAQYYYKHKKFRDRRRWLDQSQPY